MQSAICQKHRRRSLGLPSAGQHLYPGLALVPRCGGVESPLEYMMQGEDVALRALKGILAEGPQRSEEHVTPVQTACDYASAAKSLRHRLDLTLMELYGGLQDPARRSTSLG